VATCGPCVPIPTEAMPGHPEPCHPHLKASSPITEWKRKLGPLFLPVYWTLQYPRWTIPTNRHRHLAHRAPSAYMWPIRTSQRSAPKAGIADVCNGKWHNKYIIHQLVKFQDTSCPTKCKWAAVSRSVSIYIDCSGQVQILKVAINKDYLTDKWLENFRLKHT